MKRLLFTVLSILSINTLFGQVINKTEPFVIQGQLTNCPEKYLKIFFKDSNGKLLIDTLHLNNDGKFYLKSYKVIIPQRTSIQQNNIQINNIFIAPGYNLKITGIAKDSKTLFISKKITGVGSESNQYRFLLDSLISVKIDKRSWFELKEVDLLAYIKAEKKLKDSVAHIIFDKKSLQDNYLKFFGKMARFDNTFLSLYFLVAHINMNEYADEKNRNILMNNFDPKILNSLYEEKYFISDDYKNLMVSEYLNYLVNLDYKKDSTLKKIKGYKLAKVKNNFKGEIKEFALHKLMSNSVESSKSFNSLNYYKEQFEPYISELKNVAYKSSLNETFSIKQIQLLKTQIGKPAPNFTLENNFGESFSLEDFKGKVVYLDLWASWCAPCRAETPSFKLLNEKYKNDNRITFISVAVHDGVDQWKKALDEDKPNWLQLLDKDGIVSKSYVASAIPLFIIIDKKGNIVDFNAPSPSSGLQIERLLDNELLK